MRTTFRHPVSSGLLALMAASGAVPSLAQGTTQITGQLRTTINRASTDGVHASSLADNGSRIAIKGTEDLQGGLRALFGLEMGINIDSGTTTTPAYRNSYVGLSDPELGTLVMGRLDSSAPAGSPVYSQAIGIASLALSDSGATAIGNSILNGRNRTSNAVGYQSPRLKGFDVRARYYNRGDGTAAEPEDAARSLDLGLDYTSGAWKAGIGHSTDHRRGGLEPNEFRSKWQAGLRREFGWLAAYYLYGEDRYANTVNSRPTVRYQVVGTQLTSGRHTVVLNLMRRDVQTSLDSVRHRQQLAYSYSLSKRTWLQAFLDNDDVNAGPAPGRVRVVGAGVRHDF